MTHCRPGAGRDLLILMRETQLVSFDRSNNSGAIDMNMDGSVLVEKPSFKSLGLFLSSKYDSYTAAIAKTASKKIGTLIRTIRFFLLRLLFICKKIPYGLT